MKILLFIVLKVIEIGGIVFVPYFLGRFWEIYACTADEVPLPKLLRWSMGWIPILMGILVTTALLPSWFKFNWNIVNQIIK